jgi:NADPH-dependent 2,4-dienoyl-CoA reductase/sulfur reductase-like enzyme
VSGRQIHVALGTVANKQGRVAGINLGGGYATFPGVVGTAITKVCTLEVARTGLTEREAAADGYDAVAATVDTTTRAGYLPDAEPMTVKMVAERGTGRLLGAQIIGGAGAAKRIDTVATALHARMRVEEVVDLDLAYAPPFSSVWDPVAVAARVVADQG